MTCFEVVTQEDTEAKHGADDGTVSCADNAVPRDVSNAKDKQIGQRNVKSHAQGVGDHDHPGFANPCEIGCETGFYQGEPRTPD